VPITSGIHTGGGTVIGKPGNTQIEGTSAMDLGLEGIRTYM